MACTVRISIGKDQGGPSKVCCMDTNPLRTSREHYQLTTTLHVQRTHWLVAQVYGCGCFHFYLPPARQRRSSPGSRRTPELNIYDRRRIRCKPSPSLVVTRANTELLVPILKKPQIGITCCHLSFDSVYTSCKNHIKIACTIS